MEKRFEKNIGPISVSEQERLNNRKIFIAGCGGIGGYLLEYMARIGVGHIVCADKDVFDQSNLNRQILACEDSIGHKKATCAANRVRKIWPDCDVKGIDIEMTADNLPQLIEGADIVLDALDNAVSRKTLMYACRKAGVAMAHGAASGWKVQAAIVRPGKRLYELLYSEQRQLDGVLSFAAAAAAALQAGLAVRYLTSSNDAELSDWCDVLHVLDLRGMGMDRVGF